MAEQQDMQMQIQAQWMDNPGLVASPVNQYLIQAGPNVEDAGVPDSFFLTFGSTTPPVIDPNMTPEQFAALDGSITTLVVPVAKLYFTVPRLRELHKKLGEVVHFLDSAGA